MGSFHGGVSGSLPLKKENLPFSLSDGKNGCFAVFLSASLERFSPEDKKKRKAKHLLKGWGGGSHNKTPHFRLFSRNGFAALKSKNPLQRGRRKTPFLSEKEKSLQRPSFLRRRRKDETASPFGKS